MSMLSFWNQLKKQLKKKLRWRRRWLNLALVMLAVGIASGGYWLFARIDAQNESEPADRMVLSRQVSERNQPEEEVLQMINRMEGQREAFARKMYVCGEEIQHLGPMSASDVLSYYREHPELTVSLGNDEKIYFTEHVEDLSPQCKENAYFGLDDQGNLSLFEGVPGTEGNVIRTFFQLNIEYLESSLPRDTVQQLYRGIRITDLAEYNSVLSTFSDFAIEETEKVMKASPGR